MTSQTRIRCHLRLVMAICVLLSAATPRTLAAEESTEQPTASVAPDDLLKLRMSSHTVRSLLTNARRYQSPVNDQILGAAVVGMSVNDITVTPRLIPNAGSLVVSLDLSGQVHSNTTARKHAATVQSRSTTQISAEKLLEFDGENVHIHQANARAKTKSQMLGFSWGRLIGANIARQQAIQSQPASEAESARKAANRVAREMDAEIDKRVETMVDKLRARKPLLTSLKGMPVISRFRTDSEWLEWKVQSDRSLSAYEPGPLEEDIHFEINQQLLNLLGQQTLGGKTFGEDTWSELREVLPGLDIGKEPLQVRDEERAWQVTFAEEPIDINIDNGTVVVSVSFLSLRRGEEQIPPLKVTAAFNLVQERSKSGLRNLLRREGRLQVIVDKEQQGARRGIRQQIFKSMVRERFTPLVPEEIELREILRDNSGEIWQRLKVRKWSLELDHGRIDFRATGG